MKKVALFYDVTRKTLIDLLADTYTREGYGVETFEGCLCTQPDDLLRNFDVVVYHIPYADQLDNCPGDFQNKQKRKCLPHIEKKVRDNSEVHFQFIDTMRRLKGSALVNLSNVSTVWGVEGKEIICGKD